MERRDEEAWTTQSHGEEADRIVRGRDAVDLAFRASATALLFRSIAKHQPPVEFQSPLLEDAQALAKYVKQIKEHIQQNEATLPYKFLIPVQMWRDATEGGRRAELPDDLPDLLERAARGEASPEELESIAQQLDQTAVELQAYTSRLLAGLASGR